LTSTQTQQPEQDVTTSGTIIPTAPVPLISQTIIPDTNHSVAISPPELIDTNATAVLKSDSAQQSNEVVLAEAIRQDSITHASLAATTAEDFHSHRFSIESEVTPLISYRVLNLQTGNNAAQEDLYSYADSLTSLANTYSSPAFGYSAGLNFKYRLSEKFAVSAGVAYTNTGYKISHSSIPNPNVGAIADSLTGSSFGPTNNYFYPPGSDFVETARFTWLDISTTGSWIFWQRGKNELSTSAGIGISKFLKYQSANADNQKTVISYSNATTTSNSVTVNEFNKYELTTFAALNYQRTLSTHFSISGGLQFHYYVTNALPEEFYNTLHPYWAGMNIGVAYHF
jgi:hypothetical protein